MSYNLITTRNHLLMARGLTLILIITILVAVTLIPSSARALAMRCEVIEDASSSNGGDEEIEDDSLPHELQPLELSELYPAPLSGQEEYIELHNPNTVAIDITGYQLSDASGKVFTVSGTTLGFSEIAAGAYIEIPYSKSRVTLNNDGDGTLLKDAGGVLLDSATYNSALSGKSWARGDGDVWSWSTLPTPGQINIFLSSVDTGAGEDAETDPPEDEASSEVLTTTSLKQTNSALRINELLPNPEGTDSGNEWIELINPSTERTSLEGWVLTDGSTRYTLPKLSIDGGGNYLLLSSAQTKISLNNTEDTIDLIDPFGTVIDHVSYGKSTEGGSWARFTSDWSWTTTPTPGVANILKSAETSTTASVGGSTLNTTTQTPQSSQSSTKSASKASTDADVQSSTTAVLSIADAQDLESGVETTIEGVVTALPGSLGTQILYIQDGTGGMQIYSYTKAFPAELVLGSRVRVHGERAESRGMPRIKITQAADITVTGNSAPQAPETITELHPDMTGTLVSTQGKIAEKNGATWFLESGVSIALKASSGISTKGYKVGSEVQVTGIVELSNGEPRIVPRSADDLTLSEKSANVHSDDESGTSAAGTTNSSETTGGTSKEMKGKNDAGQSTVFGKATHVAKNYKTLLIALLTIAIGALVTLAVMRDRILTYIQALPEEHPLRKIQERLVAFITKGQIARTNRNEAAVITSKPKQSDFFTSILSQQQQKETQTSKPTNQTRSSDAILGLG